MRRTASPWPFSSLVLGLVLAVPTLVASLSAQVAGRNVNMVTGGTFPGGDPFLQKQNEPSIAISTRNPCHLLAGSNDYRAVNLPGLPDDLELGDAWLGWYESTDCGATWYSTLVPGYPQDNSPDGLASPVKGLSAGADPVLKSGTAGTFYYLFIAFNRGSNVGKLALARFIDHNDREVFIDPDKTPNVADRRALSSVKYVGTSEMANGSGGRFVDKPSLATFPATTGTCTMDGETVPATNVYVAWSEFVGNNPDNQKSKIYFARSANCGLSLAGPATKLSEGFPLGSGTAIAVNPNNPSDIYVVWRQIRNSKDGDAILFARSSDGGRSFTKAQSVPGLGVGQYAPFDQNTTSPAIGSPTTTFRTVGFPAVAFADDGYLYLAVSQVPGGPTGTLGGAQARITLMRTNGMNWEGPTQVVDLGADGQQFMPALAYAAGRLQLIWYDLRFDETGLTQEVLIDDAHALSAVQRRHTIDVLGAQAFVPASAWPPAFQPYGVSQPDYNDPQSPLGPPLLRGPRISQYITGDRNPPPQNDGGARQLQFNRANLRLYGGGTIPFIGDYIDIAPIPFLPDGNGKWLFNGLVNGAPPLDTALGTFQSAWTDNRDARVGLATTNPVTKQLNYTPPFVLPTGATIADVQCPVANVDNTQTRDANVYTSRITQDFSLTAPGNAKPTNTDVVRAFAVQLANNLELTPGSTTPEIPTRFKLTLANSAASFSRSTFVASPQGCSVAVDGTGNPLQPLQEIFVNVYPRSSVARTVYVTCGNAAANRVVVTATRMLGNVPGPSASVVLNPDPSNPGAKGPDGSPLGPESHTPDAENPDAENPDAENPDAENPDAENPDAENPDAENPDAENPDAENPDAENPDAENPDAENPDAENANFQDVSVDITNDGDTTSGFQAQVQTTSNTAGYSFLLMGRRVYSTPTSINCNLVRHRKNQTLFAIPLDGADLAPGPFFDENDEDVEHPTFLVRPGESIRVTLRIVRNAVTTPQPFCSANPTPATGEPPYCFDKLVFKTQAQAPNPNGLLAEDSEGSVEGADLLVEGTVDPLPNTAGKGGFVEVGSLTIRNAGTQSASDFSWVSYLFSDGTGLVSSGLFAGTGGLAPGGTIATGPFRVYIPFQYGDIDNPTAFPTGTYTVGLFADSGLQVDETDELNNRLESADSITVGAHELTFSFPTAPFLQGASETVNVTVTGAGGALISGANVALSLEGPDTLPAKPGPAASMTSTPPSALTDAAGQASFTVTIPASGDDYRIIATVDVVGVGTLKFESALFFVNSP